MKEEIESLKKQTALIKAINLDLQNELAVLDAELIIAKAGE